MLNKVLGQFRTYSLISLGLLLNAFGWVAFLLPAGIVGGGVSGVGGLIYFASGIPMGYTIITVNAVLILIALKILGAKFGVKTLFGITAISVFFIILQKVITEPIITDPFMSAIIGGLMAGAGVGLAFTQGGNSGGTDIIALIVMKYRNIPPGRIIMFLDVVIIASSWFIFGSLEKMVYGYVVMGVFSYALDLVVEGAKQSYQIMIFSDKADEIAERIGKEVGRGVTFLKARGWYSNRESEVVVVIARRHDKQMIMKIIKECDNQAFISVARVMGVFGRNFDIIRI